MCKNTERRKTLMLRRGVRKRFLTPSPYPARVGCKVWQEIRESLSLLHDRSLKVSRKMIASLAILQASLNSLGRSLWQDSLHDAPQAL